MKENIMFITKSAIQVINDESFKWKNMKIECGGSLVGIFFNRIPLILYAIDTGTNASQSGGHLVTDHNYQNKMICAIISQYPSALSELHYLGDFHMHPMYFPKMSGTDEQTSKKILHDPIHSNLPALSILITTFDSNGTIEFCPFLAIRDNINDASFNRAKLEVIDENDSNITNVLGRRYVDYRNILEAKEMHESFPHQFNTNSFVNCKIGNARLDKEIDDLRNTFKIDVAIKRADIIFCEMQFEDVKIHIFFPQEFPLNPPTIMFSQGEAEMQEYHPYYAWNSLSSIANLLEDLLVRQLGKEVKKQETSTTIPDERDKK